MTSPKRALAAHDAAVKARRKAALAAERPWFTAFGRCIDEQARSSCLNALALRRMTLARYPREALEAAFALGGIEAVDALVRDARLAAFRPPPPRSRPPTE